MLVHSPTELRSILTTAHRAGFQTATHAIGDAAIRLVIETLEELQDSAPRKSARHRIEHYELPDDDVLRRTKAAGIVASCQPNFIGQWSGPGDVYETRLGSGRFAANNPFRKIVRAHIPLCFGSDGMPYGPLFGVHWAVNGFFEDQRLSPEEAIRAATSGGAYAAFDEPEKGTLESGKLADFVVLRGDPFETPDRIAQMRLGSATRAGWPSTRMSIQRSSNPAYPPPCRTTRIAALCWPRLSPPARCPALNAASKRTGRSPFVTSKARANAFRTSSPARMFPWAAKFRPTTCPAHGKHSFPVYDAARPRASTTPTWRWAASSSDVTSFFTTSFGAIPRFSIASASGPYAVLAYAWVATAPTRAAANGTTAPTATNFDSTATPNSLVFGSNATLLNVEGRARVIAATNGRTARRFA